MEISWDGALPTQEQWKSLQGRVFECLEDIKGAQMAILTRVMLELLRCMGHLQGPSANLMNPQMATLIIGALVPCKGWATAELGNVRLASSSRNSLDLLQLSFGLELGSEPPTRLFFPAGGVAPAAANGPGNEAVLQNADAATTEQLPAAPDLAAILAAISGLSAYQDAPSAEQKNAIASLSRDTKGLVDKVNRIGNAFEKEVQ